MTHLEEADEQPEPRPRPTEDLDERGVEAADELFGNRGVYIQFGGFFAARRHEIRRYPRALFEALAAQQVAANEEVDHYIERLWGILLSAPRVPPTLAAHVAARSHSHATAPYVSYSAAGSRFSGVSRYLMIVGVRWHS